MYIKNINIYDTKISTIKFIIEYIFIINLFRDINVNIIYCKFGQNWAGFFPLLRSFADGGVPESRPALIWSCHYLVYLEYLLAAASLFTESRKRLIGLEHLRTLLTVP
jgi:hypothetical protein